MFNISTTSTLILSINSISSVWNDIAISSQDMSCISTTSYVRFSKGFCPCENLFSRNRIIVIAKNIRHKKSVETAGIEPTPRVLQTLKEILLTRFLTKQTYYTRSTIKLCSHKMHFTSLLYIPFSACHISVYGLLA